MTPATATLDRTPLDQVGAALAKRGFAIVQLADAATLRAAFPPVRDALAAFHSAHRERTVRRVACRSTGVHQEWRTAGRRAQAAQVFCKSVLWAMRRP